VLNSLCLRHALADLGRRFSRAGSAQLFVGHGRHLDVDIDAVEQRPADLAQVALDDPRRATALARRIAEKAARAPVQTSIALSNECTGRPADSPTRRRN
jgi:hypothetical protein